jgi:hypothetical protein
VDEINGLGKIFGFDVNNPSDTVEGFREPTGWDDLLEELYSGMINGNDLDRGIYLLSIWHESEHSRFKENSMVALIEIYKVRDPSYIRAYKSTGQGLEVF